MPNLLTKLIAQSRFEFFEVGSWIQYQLRRVDHRVGLVRFVDNLLKPIVRHYVQPVDSNHACAFTVRQAQAASDGLLDQDTGVGGSQRNDSVEVVTSQPSFSMFDVNDDLRRFIRTFDRLEVLNHFIFFCPGLAGVHLNDFVLVAALEEFIRLDELHELGRRESCPSDN